MATIEIKRIKRVEPKASWLHCMLCGGDDAEAADWQIAVDSYEAKYAKKQLVVLICDDCLREVVRKIADLGVLVLDSDE